MEQPLLGTAEAGGGARDCAMLSLFLVPLFLGSSLQSFSPPAVKDEAADREANEDLGEKR